jgi:hypothetical protein
MTNTAQQDGTTPVKGEPLTTATMGEVMESCTGYDEIGIEQNLGASIEELSGDEKTGKQTKALKLARAMVAVHRTHEGDAPSKAWKFAMSMRLDDVQTYFTQASPNDDDAMAPELASESGKDDGVPGAEPVTSPTSVS